MDVQLRHPTHLFQEKEILELFHSDDNEFDTLIDAVKNIRVLQQRLK